MPSSVTTKQGQAWDQIAKARLTQEKMMAVLLPENVDAMDTLLFPGEVKVTVPDMAAARIRSVPPWEKLS